MAHDVFTNFWINERAGVRKEHGSYATEEEAVAGIEAWWELHKDNYTDIKHTRTNRGALEITYGDDNYYYRIEKRTTDEPLLNKKPKKRSAGEVEKLRQTHQIDDEAYLFEELAEPYQDRLMTAFHDGAKLLTYTFDKKGRPIKKFK